MTIAKFKEWLFWYQLGIDKAPTERQWCEILGKLNEVTDHSQITFNSGNTISAITTVASPYVSGLHLT